MESEKAGIELQGAARQTLERALQLVATADLGNLEDAIATLLLIVLESHGVATFSVERVLAKVFYGSRGDSSGIQIYGATGPPGADGVIDLVEVKEAKGPNDRGSCSKLH